MALPAPVVSQLPVPSMGLPTPGGSDPLFGTYPSERAVGFGTPGLGMAESVQAYPKSQLALLLLERERELAERAGLPPGTDPNEWTGEKSAAEVNEAIAKIATVNPDLAETLIAQREGKPDVDKGFWGNITDAVGDVMSPVLSIGGKMLEILIRPSRIIPELLMPGDTDPWYEDVGQALSGKSDATWGRVLKEADWVPDFIQENNVVRGALGFTLDVLSDPITYMTFGTAGIGRKIAADRAAEAIGKHVAGKGFREMAEGGMMKHLGGMSVDEYAAKIYDDLINIKRPRTGQTGTVAAEGVRAIDDDAAAFLAGSMARESEKNVVRNMLEAADQTHRMITTSGAGGIRDAYKLTGATFSKAEANQLLSQGRAAAMAVKDYHGAKAFAAAQGGIRFRFAVPWTDLKYISAPLIPVNMSFQPMRRMFTGTSAGHRLIRHIEAGGATWGDFNTWVNDGIKGLAKQKPAVYQLLRGSGMGSLGSMHMPLSEQLGRVTGNMSTHAKQWRGGGLQARLAADTNIGLRTWREELLNAGWNLTEVDGRTLVTGGSRQQIMARAGKELSEEPARRALYHQFRESIPLRFHSADELKEWWTDNRLVGRQGEDLAQETASMDQAAEVFESVSAGEREVLFDLRELEDKMATLGNREGAAIGNITEDLELLPVANEPDIGRWNATSRDDVRDLRFSARNHPDEVLNPDARRAGAGFSSLDARPTNGSGYGTVLEVGPGGGAPLAEGVATGPVYAANVRKVLHVDQRPVDLRPGKMTLDDAPKLDELNVEARKVVTQAQAGDEASQVALMEAGIDLPTEAGAETIADKADQLVTEALRKNDVEGILVHAEDGGVRLTVFDSDTRHIKKVSDQAASSTAGRGFFPRVYTEAADEFLSGRMPEDELRRVIYGEPKLHHDIRRAFPDDPFLEAERKAKNTLKEHFDEADHQAIDDLELWERDPIRAHQKYVERTTEAVLHEQAGFNAGRIAYLSDVAPATFGGPAGKTVYRIKGSVLDPETLSKLPGPVQQALERSRKATERATKVEAQNAEASDVVTTRLRAALEGSLPPQGSPAGQVQRAARELRGKARRTGSDIANDVSNGLRELSRVKARLKKATGAEKTQLEATQGAIEQHVRDLRREMKDFAAPAAPASKLPPPAQGMARLFRGEGPGSTPGGHAFTDTPSAARRYGENVTYVDVPADVAAAAKRRAAAANDVGYDLPDEFARQAFNQPLPGRATAAREATATGDLAESAERMFGQLSRQEARAAVRLESVMNRMADAQAEVNRVVASYRGDVQAALKPALVPIETARTGFVPLQVKGLEGLAMHPYIAAEFHSVLENVGFTGLHKQWRQFTGIWKEWATFRYPGFHVRNHMGAFFNNVLGGVTIADYRFSSRLRKSMAGKGTDDLVDGAMFRKYHLGRMFPGREADLTHGELANRISDMGIGMGNARATADIRTTAEAIESEVKRSGKRGFLRRMDTKSKHIPFSRAMGTHYTEVTENMHRFAAFLGGLKQTGGDFHGARGFTMMRHGDYLDLTDFEQNFVKDVVPFYKWLRTNLPYQLRNLFENPAMQVSVMKARDAAFHMQGLDPAEEKAKLPKWMREEVAFPVPLPGFLKNGSSEDVTSYMMLDLPMSDMFTGMQEFASSTLPLIRPFIESFVAEKNLFTGAPLGGKMVELTAWAKLPVVSNILEATGMAKRNTEGKLMVNDKYQNLLTTVPIFSRFRNWMYAEPDRSQLRATTIASTIFGIGLRPFGDEELSKAEMSFYFDEVVPLVDMYRELGVDFPSVTDLDPGIFTTLGLDLPESLQPEAAETPLLS